MIGKGHACNVLTDKVAIYWNITNVAKVLSKGLKQTYIANHVII